MHSYSNSNSVVFADREKYSLQHLWIDVETVAEDNSRQMSAISQKLLCFVKGEGGTSDWFKVEQGVR